MVMVMMVVAAVCVIMVVIVAVVMAAVRVIMSIMRGMRAGNRQVIADGLGILAHRGLISGCSGRADWVIGLALT